MDAPAMLTRKHIPEDVGLRNVAEDEGSAGQGQLHRDEKQHKPVLKKVKEKVKKIKKTLAGHGHDQGNGGDQHVGDGGSNSSEEGEEDALEREAAVEKGGYMEDVEDKPVVTESDPEVHGAPMYESERAPHVQDLVARYEPAPARIPAVQEVEGDDAPKVRLGDLGGPVVEDPAAPHSTTPAAREGEDIGTTPVVREFESMTLSDDPAHVGAAKEDDVRAEEWKDAATDKMDGASGGGASYTDRLKNAAAGTTEYGKKIAYTVYEKVAGVGSAVGAGKRDDERAEAVPASDAGGEEWKDSSATTETTGGAGGAGYTDKIKSAAASTTEYGKQMANTVYEKVACAGAAVTPSLRPQVGSGETEAEHGRSEAMPASEAVMQEPRGTAAADAVMGEPKEAAATDSGSGAGYTDKIKSAAAGTTEYGKQLASTVYEKVAGVGTAVVGKVQQATQSTGTTTPGVGAQQEHAGTTAVPGAAETGSRQDKGVTMTGYIAEKLRPGDEERSLSQAIAGAVQQQKEYVGGTVAQRVPAPGQMMTKAREAVTSLTGGNRFSETVQPTVATGLCDAGADVKKGDAVDAPVVRGEEVGDAKLNTNTM